MFFFKSFGLAAIFLFLLFTALAHSAPISEKLTKRSGLFPIITQEASDNSDFDVQAVNQSLDQRLGLNGLLQGLIGPPSKNPADGAGQSAPVNPPAP